MPPSGTSDADYGAEFSFAVEYSGPPVTYDLPCAVPIKVERIPVAAAVAQVSLSDKLSLPVVQPLLAPDPRSKKFSRELKTFGSDSSTLVSPTSVIAFDRNNESGRDCKELELVSEATVSPTSVIAFEEGNTSNRGYFRSGELSSSRALEFSDGHYAYGELCDVANTSRELGFSSISHEHSPELLGGTGISSTIEFSDSFDKSLGSSMASRVSCSQKESLDTNNDLSQADWVSNESVSSFDYPSSSSRVSSMKVVDGNNESKCDLRRTPVVTFRDSESVDAFDEEYTQDASEMMSAKRMPQVKGKKGSCYRCFKGNRFTEKEVCIVCDAKYCSNCVLRAMGSMPEGRKCVTCIGFPIDESKRGNLGKCSRMLKRLLNDLEVRQIMRTEKLCEANQLPPEFICVNTKPLSHEELVILQTCTNPPEKLKPGNYWYDTVSGLWGKEGQKPSKIISPHLNVGGPIKPDASNGKTQVFINGREITKVELRMLQLAGVQCAGNPHFWVHDDGSYQEEGQKNTRGYLWGKAGTKLVCALLSLPVPSKFSSSCGEQVSNIVNRTVPDYLQQRILQKLLLIGYNGSGASTIFNQAKILYKEVSFSAEERENIKLKIQSNVYGYLGILLEGRELFEEEEVIELKKKRSSHIIDPSGNTGNNDDKTIYSVGPRLKAFSDWLLKTMVSGNLETIFPAATREYAPLVEELWNDPSIQATYNRRSELEMLPTVASYFLERVITVLRTDYEPSNLDILNAEGVTSLNGLACVDFSFPQSAPDANIDAAGQHDSLLRYQLIRVHARGLGENCKWLEMFEDVGMVIFCVALSDYDQFSVDGNGSITNKMVQSRQLFEFLVNHSTFDQMDFLLILNKFDLFEEKIERVSLTQCDWFHDFRPVLGRHHSNSNSNSINNSPSLGHLASHYIAVKFKRLYSSLTGRKLYVSLVKGLESDTVDAALKYAREILKWDEERANFNLSEYSIYSTEVSSFSQ